MAAAEDEIAERGIAAGRVMREAVAEIEAAWTELLGEERFAELRGLLVELNRRI